MVFRPQDAPKTAPNRPLDAPRRAKDAPRVQEGSHRRAGIQDGKLRGGHRGIGIQDLILDPCPGTNEHFVRTVDMT